MAVESAEMNQVALESGGGLLVLPFSHIEGVADGQEYPSLSTCRAAGGVELVVKKRVGQEPLFVLR